MAKFRFREMTEEDIPYVCEIQQSAFGIRTPEDFEKCLKNSVFFYGVALYNEIIVGYFGVSFIAEECEILTIAVDKMYRQMKCGTQIMKMILSLGEIKNVKSFFLEMDEKNIPAYGLYTKIGFKKYKIREKYYGNTDAWLLKLEW